MLTKNIYSGINGNGTFDRQAVVPSSDRFFFVGFFWTISEDKQKNQLDNL